MSDNAKKIDLVSEQPDHVVRERPPSFFAIVEADGTQHDSVESLYRKHGCLPADWERFRGNNYHEIARPNVTWGGSVSFAAHLGRPLSDRLWVDLVHRLCATGICIYGPRDCQWLVGWGPGHCTINLDEEGRVRDIQYTPHQQSERSGSRLRCAPEEAP